MDAPNFALFCSEDAYSTEGKVMGRQSAGKALLRGVARRWPKGGLHAYGSRREQAVRMLQQLESDGYRGILRHRPLEGDAGLDALGAVYHPAPLTPELAWTRNARGPASYSLFGVTHTLCSHNAMEQTAALVLPPYKPWDGLICTSRAAHDVVSKLQEELREWYAQSIGATCFNLPSMPVIPLGIDAPSFLRTPDDIAQARARLGIAGDEVVFLFAGRLAFHAKANPAPMYQALETAARGASHGLVCIEAGVFANPHFVEGYRTARRELAPSVRFVEIDGEAPEDYRAAWRAGDVFISLSDNVQETFGLTPLEAMAAGMPALVSDWNGYRETVRDGIDGFRIPVFAPAEGEGAGAELARRYANGADTYDLYIGRASMATVIDPVVLADRMGRLVSDSNLRRQMGEAGRRRAIEEFDWPIILDRYCDFAARLGELRKAASRLKPQPPTLQPLRPDPFRLFSGHATQGVNGGWRVGPSMADTAPLTRFMNLAMTNYVLQADSLRAETISRVHAAATDVQTVDALLQSVDVPREEAFRAMMWLLKFGLLTVQP